MERVVLEKAWLDSYEFDNLSIEESVKKLSELPSKTLAASVYQAAMELRADGVNWYGGDFEDELVEVMKKGDLVITNADVHISVEEYKEVVEFRNNLEEKGIETILEEAKNKSALTKSANKGKDTELDL